jgi:hypothetical protein
MKMHFDIEEEDIKLMSNSHNASKKLSNGKGK